MSGMTKVDDNNFENEVLQSDRLTLVDFGATWCAPCKKLHPIMNDLADDFSDTVKVVEVDVGASPATAMKFGVTSVPQLLFFKDGSVKETVIGLLPKSKIEAKIEGHLN
jgi:thioredoxin 1